MAADGYYAIRFVGHLGMGLGGICLHKGRIIGIDSNDARYHGSFKESRGRIKGTFTLTIPDGGTLITGLRLPAGMPLEVTLDWPSDFAGGVPQSVLVGENPVAVVLEKIGELE